ncbi:uncharacterized protein LOC126883981 [Diabrotica virgifera virgifera]|uniref:Myb/SANT-like DNA-binding domain-containing protein n=1 Tax=Diabrotica virgifera virgifera TaxID=50390 RepID=A0ABM5K688_DIAVI|nr:uncharacterized protein LOC126883981 [Diabrotica virgifera virgifera]
MDIEGLGQYLVFNRAIEVQTPQQPLTEGQQQSVNWTTNHSKILLDIYNQYRGKVGTFQIKTFKKLWEIMAQEINAVAGTNFSAGHCENRWRVLERAYKKFIDNKNKTGRGKKYFEYEAEMNEIFKGKMNIKPEVTITTESFQQEPVLTPEAVNEPVASTSNVPSTSEKPKETGRHKKTAVTRIAIMQQMQIDRKAYYDKRIELEQEKIKIQREKLKELKERKCSECLKKM